MTDIKPKLSGLEARHMLWRRSTLTWKLDKNQRLLYDMFYNSKSKVQTWLLARRSGKTYALCILAIEQCIKNPNSVVKFVAPTKLQINTILRSIMKEILADCPIDIAPTYSARDYIYYFKNGSEMQLAGSESGHIEKLRGGNSNLAIIDEAGDVSDLDNAVKSILLPTTLTTNGKVLLAGTPPKHAEHDFIKFIEESEIRGTLIKKTIYDNPRLSIEQIKEIELEQGGANSEAFRREMLCEVIKDTKTAVIPEFNDENKKFIIKEWPRPPHFDAYVAMDLGTIDLTAIVFGYYDFRAGKVIIEDEIVCDFTQQNMNIKAMCELITKKEESLWFNHITNEIKKPYMRVSDIDYIALKEIVVNSANRLSFAVTAKDDKETAINNLRTLIGSRKLIIHPRCVNLIRHLDNVKWRSANNKLTFARSPDNGHYDFCDAIVYLVRNIAYSKNPYPLNYDLKSDNYYMKPYDQRTQQPEMHKVLNKLFKRKR